MCYVMHSENSRKCRKFCENTHKNVKILISLNVQKGSLTWKKEQNYKMELSGEAQYTYLDRKTLVLFSYGIFDSFLAELLFKRFSKKAIVWQF